jgi:hypothetical protein
VKNSLALLADNVLAPNIFTHFVAMSLESALSLQLLPDDTVEKILGWLCIRTIISVNIPPSLPKSDQLQYQHTST